VAASRFRASAHEMDLGRQDDLVKLELQIVSAVTFIVDATE
jgi:hypothetical protein